MAISDREQRLLDEMERQLYRSEADVVQTARSVDRKPDYRAIVIGVVFAVIGLALLLGGVMMNQIFVGVFGFAAMLGGVLYVVSPKKKTSRTSDGSQRTAAPSGAKRTSTSFGERMESRWNQRGEGQR